MPVYKVTLVYSIKNTNFLRVGVCISFILYTFIHTVFNTAVRYDCLFKVVKHIEMPNAAPQKSICHFQKQEMILK